MTAAAFAFLVSGPRFGYCTVYDRTYPAAGQDPASPKGFLDAGAMLPLSGPNVPAGAGLGRLTSPFGASYAYQAASPFQAGLYTMTGSGGTQVGSFTVSTTFPESFTVTNWDSITAVDRRNPLKFNWTGGGFSLVNILVITNVLAGSNRHVVTVSCSNVPASLGSYPIPPEALAYLTPGSATLAVYGVNQTKFTPPLVGGGRVDFGSFSALLGVNKDVPIQ
jgi:hypothetical protein